jgi:hypothetical protein
MIGSTPKVAFEQVRVPAARVFCTYLPLAP